MNTTEFYTWLSGYLTALESEGIETCKIKNKVIKYYDKISSINKSV